VPNDQNVLEVLASDHQAVFGLLDRLDVQTAGVLFGKPEPADEGLREQLVIQCVRHFVAEEQYLWPLVRDHLAHGDTLSDAGFTSNRSIEDALKGLENPQADAEYLSVQLASIRRQLTDHVNEQQDQLFPHLADQVDPAELNRLGRDVVAAAQLAPTRPRTVAPENPALNKVSSLVEGFIDQVRDSVSHRGAGEL